ncbi:membrane protein [Actinoplanes sp. NBRC 14428]|nr:membrane protein [Actinoplanes sp. NBRC 14428]
MTKLLLSLHVLAAIVAIGPVTVAASMFPATTRRVLTGADPDPAGIAVLRNLHRICRVYAGLGILVPVFGLATASSLGVLTDAWLIVSMALTAVAAGILVFAILPGQVATLAADLAPVAPGTATGPPEYGEPGPAASTGRSVAAVAARLGMVTGVFNLVWATVVVLMIIRPGSTTGA